MEFERVKAKRKSLNPFFSSGGPKDAGQPRKKEEVLEGRRQRAYYAGLEVEVRGRKSKRAKPYLFGERRM